MNYERGLISFNDLYQKWIDELYDPEPVEVQRQFQANIDWSQDILNTIFDQHMCMPEITLVKSNISTTNIQILEALDGCQRTLSMLRFRENKYKTGNETEFHGTTIGDLYYNELPRDAREHFDNFELSAVIYGVATTASEKAEIFFKLNNGMPLSRAQKRNATRSEASTFIRSVSRIGVKGSKTLHAVDQHELFYFDSRLDNDKNPTYTGKWLTKFKTMNYDTLATRMLLFLIKDSEADGTNYDYNEIALTKFYNNRNLMGADGIPGEWVQHKKTMIEILDNLLLVVKPLKIIEFEAQNKRGRPPQLTLNEAFDLFIIMKKLKDQNLVVSSPHCFANSWHKMRLDLINRSDPNIKDSFCNILTKGSAQNNYKRCKQILDYILNSRNDFSLFNRTMIINVSTKQPETLTL